jgi:hypothetical protein
MPLRPVPIEDVEALRKGLPPLLDRAITIALREGFISPPAPTPGHSWTSAI